MGTPDLTLTFGFLLTVTSIQVLYQDTIRFVEVQF
jgi:hypothetical protein